MLFTLYGNFIVEYTSESHHAKSLEALGHKVIRLQENTTTTDEVLAQSLKADALIWIHTHSFINDGRPMREVLSILRQRGIPTIAYHLDLYNGIPERWRHYQQHDYFNVQYFFTPDKNFANWFTANKNKGYYLPAGVYHVECNIPDNKMVDAPEIIFVGTKNYHRQWPYRAKLVDWLSATYGDRFAHYGNDGIRVIRGQELNELYQASKIVVGDSFSPNFDYPYFWSDRVYETTGRGGFIIHPYIKGLEQEFNNEELATYKYGDFEGLKNLIDKYLVDIAEREQIRLSGHLRTKSDHTYLKRWQRILEVVK